MAGHRRLGHLGRCSVVTGDGVSFLQLEPEEAHGALLKLKKEIALISACQGGVQNKENGNMPKLKCLATRLIPLWETDAWSSMVGHKIWYLSVLDLFVEQLYAVYGCISSSPQRFNLTTCFYSCCRWRRKDC